MNTMKPGQTAGLNLIKMPWHGSEQAVYAWQLSSVAKLKQFCEKHGLKFLHSYVKHSRWTINTKLE